jgi:hypothetical protein
MGRLAGGPAKMTATSILNMSFHDEYRIVINEAQRRLLMRAICCHKCHEGYLRWLEYRP